VASSAESDEAASSMTVDEDVASSAESDEAASSMAVDEDTFCQNPFKILSRVDIERALLCQKLLFLITI
jgi:hypothetical protein